MAKGSPLAGATPQADGLDGLVPIPSRPWSLEQPELSWNQAQTPPLNLPPPMEDFSLEPKANLDLTSILSWSLFQKVGRVPLFLFSGGVGGTPPCPHWRGSPVPVPAGTAAGGRTLRFRKGQALPTPYLPALPGSRRAFTPWLARTDGAQLPSRAPQRHSATQSNNDPTFTHSGKRCRLPGGRGGHNRAPPDPVPLPLRNPRAPCGSCHAPKPQGPIRIPPLPNCRSWPPHAAGRGAWSRSCPPPPHPKTAREAEVEMFQRGF